METQKNPTEYWSRLESAMKARSVSLADLAKHLGLTIQAVRKLPDGKTKELSATNNAKAAKFLGVDPSWLAIGEASSWPFSTDISRFEALTERQKGMVQQAIEQVLEKIEASDLATEDKNRIQTSRQTPNF
jgi:transcriptional regulator with XRE-family HTH domain